VDAQANYERIAEMAGKGFATAAELQAAQVSLDTARQGVSRAQESLKQARQQLSLDLKGAQPEELAIAKANVDRAQAQLDNVAEELGYTTVRAPISGTVLTRPVEIGTAVASGTTGQSGGTAVATIGDLSTLYVKARIEEADLGRVSVGLPTRITFDAYAGWLWSGKVKKIYPQGEGAGNQQNGGGGGSTGTRFPVDIAIDLASAKMEQDSYDAPSNMASSGGGSRRPPSTRGGGGGRRRGGGGSRGGSGSAAAAPATPAPVAEGKRQEEAEPPAKPKLLPQLTASVEIVLEDHPDVMIVPAQYIKFDAGKAYVEVAANEEEPKVRERREVELGFSDGLRYEVKSGVKEGEIVVLEREIKEDQRM
jgi:multidrug efflux pump subunit AcrA (membrane-fusion protein)